MRSIENTRRVGVEYSRCILFPVHPQAYTPHFYVMICYLMTRALKGGVKLCPQLPGGGGGDRSIPCIIFLTRVLWVVSVEREIRERPPRKYVIFFIFKKSDLFRLCPPPPPPPPSTQVRYAPPQL